MKEKALRTKIDELVATLQQRIDIVTATAVSQFEQETENNYAKLDYLKAHFKKDDSINDWLNDKQEFTEKLDKLESQITELSDLADEWEIFIKELLLTDAKL
ncbi:protein BLI1 [Kluyveromyces marxianus]|uniref:Biogenesis of lysosome-related organelles complex 1 subunit BLI1 n=2 Tax=Kluyveromyces marxianus TaxID=4911 RepID=W0T9V8_KLUMD|nr:hypothetical protein KLMA_40383 [Kluyveromyces marxianus DMKU3-1042]QGN16139.1 protein BLI1 [Kluyveromyces marxianus]BAO40407.1 hypothetical protein KLMA_40383 [Kluyveromyces marxianus DMKU3-1042]